VQFRPLPRILVAVTLSDRKYIRFLRCEFARTRSALASQANGRMMGVLQTMTMQIMARTAVTVAANQQQATTTALPRQPSPSQPQPESR